MRKKLAKKPEEMNYREMIAALRKRLPAIAIAQKIGVSKKTIYRWISGETRITLENYVELRELYERATSGNRRKSNTD